MSIPTETVALCKYCGKEVYWYIDASGKRRPHINGILHTCPEGLAAWNAAKAAKGNGNGSGTIAMTISIEPILKDILAELKQIHAVLDSNHPANHSNSQNQPPEPKEGEDAVF